MKTKAELIAALIADEKSPFTEADKPALEALEPEHLETLSKQDRAANIGSLIAATKPAVKPTEAEVKAAADKKAADEKAAKAAADKKASDEAAARAAAGKKDEPKQLTREEYLAQAPVEIRSQLEEGLRVAEERKAAAIKSLRDSKRCDLTEDQLKAKSQSELDALVKLAQLNGVQGVDYSGRGTVRVSESEQKVASVDQNAQNEAIKAAATANRTKK